MDGKKTRGTDQLTCIRGDREDSASRTRYSQVRWKVQVKKICKKLGTYDYVDVKNKLKERTRRKRKTNKRDNLGCYLPTDRQLSQYLARAEWSVEIVPAGPHNLAKYEYRDDRQSTTMGKNDEHEDR